MIEKRIYDAPALCRQEILRYAGVRGTDEAAEALLNTCLQEVENKLTYRVCCLSLPVARCTALFPSASLAETLAGCHTAIVFAATVGTELDRLLTRYGHTSPAKALMLQAIGAERIEALCDTFCQDMGASTRRFSPGYGDFPLESQRELFRLLDPQRQIGVFLTDSLLMTPSKSVTAIFGLKDGKTYEKSNKCMNCSNLSCNFRSTL